MNAYTQEILLETKAILEEHGWRVVHGIVDSVWVTPMGETEQTPLDELTAEILEQVDIRLERETRYDWIAFVPLRDSDAGALTKYFDKVAGEDEYKYCGIECLQRSTPPFVDDAQNALIAALNEHREPEPVCEELRSWLDRLLRGDIDPADLVLTTRVSKLREEYMQSTRSVGHSTVQRILG